MKYLFWGGYTQIKHLFRDDLHLTVWAVTVPHMSFCLYLGCRFQVSLQLLCKQKGFRIYFKGDVSNFQLSQQSQLMPRVWHTLGTWWPCDRVPGTWLTHVGCVMGTRGAQHTRASEETKFGTTTQTAEMREGQKARHHLSKSFLILTWAKIKHLSQFFFWQGNFMLCEKCQPLDIVS